MKKRIAAEWEPALGVLVAWPPLIPKKLFKEFNSDTVLYIMVEDEEVKDDAVRTFEKWELNLEKIKFIFTPSRNGKSKYGAYWVRDWGPFAVFNEDKSMKLVSGRFCSTPATFYGNPSELFEVDDINVGSKHTPLDKPTGPETYMPANIAHYFKQHNEIYDFAFIGGNVLTDGLDMLVSSSILFEENKQMNTVSPEEYFQRVAKSTVMNTYAVTDQYEDFGIQHVDCIMKVVDEDTFLIAEPPKDHSYYNRIESIIDNTIKKIRNFYGKPYNIVRYKTNRYSGEHLAAYSNSLILNKTVYVPMFGIEEDKAALETWAQVLPGYVIKGIEFVVSDEPETQEGMFYPEIGWDAGDALHCRTRAVWDPDMLFISIDKLSPKTKSGQNRIESIVVDYSGHGLEEGSAKLMWREKGTDTWNETPLKPTSVHDRFDACIDLKKGRKYEYYVTASNRAGTLASRPATAPVGFYTTEAE